MSESLTKEIGFNFKMTPELAMFLRVYGQEIAKNSVEIFAREFGFKPKTRKRVVSFNYCVRRLGISRHKLKEAIQNGQIKASQKETGRYEVDINSVENFFNLQY